MLIKKRPDFLGEGEKTHTHTHMRIDIEIRQVCLALTSEMAGAVQYRRRAYYETAEEAIARLDHLGRNITCTVTKQIIYDAERRQFQDFLVTGQLKVCGGKKEIF